MGPDRYGEDALEGQRLHQEAIVATEAGDHRTALGLFQRASEAYSRAEDLENELHNRDHAATYLVDAGRYIEALAVLGPAFRTRELGELSESTRTALGLCVYGYCRITVLKPAKLANYREGFALLERLHGMAKAGSLYEFGPTLLDKIRLLLHEWRCDWSSALHAELALRRRGHGNCAATIARIYVRLGRSADAAKYLMVATENGEAVHEGCLDFYHYWVARTQRDHGAFAAAAAKIWGTGIFDSENDRLIACEAMAKSLVLAVPVSAARPYVCEAIRWWRSESAYFRFKAFLLLGDYHLASLRELGEMPLCDLEFSSPAEYRRLPFWSARGDRHLEFARRAYRRAEQEARHIDSCLEILSYTELVTDRWRKWNKLCGLDHLR